MFHYVQNPLYPQPAVSSGSHLRREDITLVLRQQPKEALVTTDGKEKARKPVDPPPIIQLTVKSPADPSQHFLQSPYLFMCTSLYKLDKNEAWEGNANKSLAGSLVSSLHRLKDVDNKDGGFFVFGDISVKVQGTFRLHFSLFDLRKDTNDVQYLGCITSEPFRVLLPKDFKGMDESTYLSRAFSDQGVRLRLRKEPRAMIGNKRPYPYSDVSPASNTPARANMGDYPPYGEETTSSNKRFRLDTEDRKETFVENSSVSGSTFPSSYVPSSASGSTFSPSYVPSSVPGSTFSPSYVPSSVSGSTFSPSYAPPPQPPPPPPSQYAVRMPSITPSYSIGQYTPGFGNLTTTSTPYGFRPSIDPYGYIHTP